MNSVAKHMDSSPFILFFAKFAGLVVRGGVRACVPLSPCAGLGWLCGVRPSHACVAWTSECCPQPRAYPLDAFEVMLAAMDAAFGGEMPLTSAAGPLGTEFTPALDESMGPLGLYDVARQLNSLTVVGSTVGITGRMAMAAFRFLESILPGFRVTHAEHSLRYKCLALHAHSRVAR